jgi:uncharacterized protein DUF2537
VVGVLATQLERVGPDREVSVGPDVAAQRAGLHGYGLEAVFTVTGMDCGSPGISAGMHPGEPTPWATGLTVSVVAASIIVIALLSLSQGLAPNGTGFVVLANLLVAVGLAPSIWLGRATPIWRWVAYGTAVGIVLTWIALLLSLLD